MFLRLRFKKLILVAATLAAPLKALDLKMLDSSLNRIDRAFQLEIPAAGFGELSAVAMDKLKKDLSHLSLGDHTHYVGWIGVEAKDLSVDIDWKDFSVRPAENGFNFKLEINEAQIDATELSFRNYPLPLVSTTCGAAKFKFGGGKPLSFNFDVALAMGEEEGKIALEKRNFAFDLEDDQYQAQAPESCYGPLGNRAYFLEFIVSIIVNRAKDKLVTMVHKKVDESMPLVEDKVNGLFDFEIGVDLEEQLILPETRLAISFGPKELILDEEKMNFELFVKITPLDEKPRLNKRAGLGDGLTKAILATLGVNPEALNTFLAVMFKNGGPLMELYPSMSESLATLMDVDVMANFWPELMQIPTDTSRMRLFVGLKAAPTILLDAEKTAIHLGINDLVLRYMIQQNGRWKDYSKLIVSTALDVKVETKEGQQLFLDITPYGTKVRNQWASTYTPTDASFNEVDSSELLGGLLSAALARAKPLHFQLPVINARTGMAIDHVRLDEPFLKLDLVH